MRPIKFRAWDKEKKKMIFDVDLLCGSPYTTEFGSSKGDTLRDGYAWPIDGNPMQYTGLKDKNGKPVYEGDIVSKKDFQPLKVYWNEKGCGWSLKNETHHMALSDLCQPLIEVIGNIYEN